MFLKRLKESFLAQWMILTDSFIPQQVEAWIDLIVAILRVAICIITICVMPFAFLLGLYLRMRGKL